MNFKFRLYLDKRYAVEVYGEPIHYQVKVRATLLRNSKHKILTPKEDKIFTTEKIFYALFPHLAPASEKSKKVFQERISTVLADESNLELKSRIEKRLRTYMDADAAHINSFELLQNNLGYKPASDLLKDWFTNKTKSREEVGRFPYALKSFKDYFIIHSKSEKEPDLWDITPHFLNKWKEWMQQQNAAVSTIAGYAKDLRTVLNMAKKSNTSQYDSVSYPFSKGSEQEPDPFLIQEDDAPISKYISDEERLLFQNYKPTNRLEELAHDLWFFSYYSLGINMKDIYNLKWSQISPDKSTFYFYRQKTRRNEIQKRAIIQTNEFQRNILEKYAGKSHVFIFIDDPEFPTHKKLIGKCYKRYKSIGAKLGLNKEFCHQSARHAAMTNLNKTYTPEQIREIGNTHAKVAQTKHYIKKLNQEQERESFFNTLHNS